MGFDVEFCQRRGTAFGGTSHKFTTWEVVGIGIGATVFGAAFVIAVYYLVVCIRGMGRRRQQPADDVVIGGGTA